MIAMEDSRIDWRGGLFTRLMATIVGTGLRVAVMTALPAIQQNIIERQQGE